MDKIGLTFSGDLPFPEVLRRSKMAEEAGMHSIWVAEHFFNRDALCTAAAIAASTRRIILGTGIVSPYSRHISLLAMGAMTLSEMTQGRFILGLGTNARFLKQLGIDDESPVTTIRRAVSTLNALFANTETDLGMTYGKGEKVKLGFTSGKSIPIYIGAIGPKMCRITGEVASGVILSAGSTPSYVKRAVEWMREGHGGTLPASFEVACYIITTRGNSSARGAARERLARMMSLPGREVMMGDLESDERIPKIRDALRRKKNGEAASLVGDDMLDLASISGSVDHCLERLEQFRRAGVTLPVISPMGEGADEMLSIFAQRQS